MKNTNRNDYMKRIVTIQDISCVGKCSLTVALPIISAMGIETSIIPTAVLSTHTVFNNFTFKDLTDQIEPISNHWKEEKFNFDAIYTGYLGSKEQVNVISKFFDDFKSESNFIFVDPAMADNGKLYPSFNDEFVEEMKKLCSKADIISPNLTEAAMLTGREYKTEYDYEYIKEIAKELYNICGGKIIITGIELDGKYGNLCFDGDKFNYFTHERANRVFHGTGDVFSSVCVGALAKGKSLGQAVELAGNFTFESIKATLNNPDARYYGVDFESVLYKLTNI